jgi:hypothetical protein
MKIKVMKFPKQYTKAPVSTLVTGSPEEGTRIFPLSASGDSGGSASDSPTTVPRTLYGHKIYLPLADYPKSDPIHHHTSEHNSRRHYYEQQQPDQSGSSPSPSAASKDDIEPRRPDVLPSKDDFGPRLPEVALGGLERLVRCHAIWFLPTVSREEAVSFLHAKEEGVSTIF